MWRPHDAMGGPSCDYLTLPNTTKQHYLTLLKGRFLLTYKLILNDGHGFPETAAVIFFSKKFVFLERQQVQPFPIRRRVWE